jgi:hypothetical protein
MPGFDRVGGGFTEGELQFASFWVRYRILLRRVGHGVLIALNVVLWGYGLWGLLDAYAISYPRESRITADIANDGFIASQFERNRPQNIQTGAASVFQGTESRLDLVVPVNNPNTEWWAEFTYRFNVSGEMTPARTGFLLPGQKSYLGEFGYKPKTMGARSGVFTADNLRWHRTDPSLVGADYKSWISRRNQLKAEDIQFLTNLPAPAGTTGNAASQQLSRTSFTFVNPSAYGFWTVQLYVILKRAGAPVAATSVTLNNVQAGERRPVNIDWFEKLPQVTETEVVPVVNFLDRSAYLPTTPPGE